MTGPESERRSWRCRLGWHHWRKAFTDDNEVYVACRRCGKEADDTLSGPPTMG